MKKSLAILALALLLAPIVEARIARSQAAKVAFSNAHVCPSTGLHRLPCKGYVIDHINPLDCGGADSPKNMQYQTIAEGKAKDRVERLGCKGGKRIGAHHA